MSKIDVNLGELKFESLGDKAANHIRNKIVCREYPPGMKLPEENFASGLGVSRACIREAFMILEAEGLLRRERNKYTEVVGFTHKDIEEIMDLRRAIEILSIETFAKKDIYPINELERQIAVIGSINESDIENTVEADLNFHEIIVRAADNDRILNVWLRLKGQMMVLLYAALKNKASLYRTHALAVHKAIVQALRTKNLEMASEQIRMHIDQSAEQISREINQTSL